ncbi:hypothetical protein JTE90_016348 [Oedothorax gibbosus]|uniref:Uncharacterized protein n=1 Tax=Oedothorax gibbosus TaxID=931172 RepID=A0AAV6TK93_9ARAC|nr:hypothetical protein JTE90_016348 [Oedothorax gibbosus]
MGFKGESIQDSEFVRDLGVLVSNDFKMSKQCVEANLSILLDVEVDELVESTRHPGIKLTLHDDSFSPDIHTDGQLIEPGMSYSIAISKVYKQS